MPEPRRQLSANERAVVDLLLAAGTSSRADLAAATGLSKPATNELVARLVDAQLVAEAGEVTTARRGPNAMHYRVVPDLAFTAGVEMQPTHVRAAVADVTGRTRAEVDVPHRDEEPAALVAAAVHRAAREADLGTDDLTSVVVGTPGVVTPEGDVHFVQGHPGWRAGQRQRLAQHLGCPVTLENDVNLAAIAEAAQGEGRGAASFTLLRLDEGLGAATVLGGQLLRGAHGWAGELGLTPVGPAVGDLGTPETGFQGFTGEAALAALLTAHGSAPDVAAALAGHDPATHWFRAEAARRVAVIVAVVCTLIDPERVLLTGRLARAGGARLAHDVQECVAAASPLRPHVAPAALDDGAVVLGALALGVAAAQDLVFGPWPAASTTWSRPGKEADEG